MYQGRPSYDLGPGADVLDGCPKETGMVMLVRSMGPDIIATDEIGKREDVYAIEAALCAGIGILTTIHGSRYEDIVSSGIGEAVSKRAFHKLIFLSNNPKTGSIKEIIDA
jgi:stage III sporulation protein AA